MSQYGVAWFGFDEASGNIVDKLGSNYVGTVTGATRVGSWNGEGSSMNFNGNGNKIDTNLIHSHTSFTYKLKFKCPVNGGGYMLTAGRQGTSDINGYGIFVNKSSGRLELYYWYNSVSGTLILSDYSNYNFKDNIWHNLIFNQDATLITVYVDDRIVGTYRHTSNIILSKTPLRIGYLNVSTFENWFLGQLDDLQIYNKALSPSDFTQKRLAVKTTDNKNLVLSPTSTRIKEIPNTEENTLLAQGGVVKEIDSAVDRPPLDFTKPTTEYEIVTNNRTPLGKGRMFTIPFGTDFKTAMIEDNY